MVTFVPPPEACDATAPADVSLRFDDVTQDGRVVLDALPEGIGASVWRALADASPVRAAIAQGVVPILSRLVLEGAGGPFSVHAPLTARGRYAFAHARGADGAVERLFMNVWVDLEGPRGRTYPPQPDGHGETIDAGRVFAEHVITRPFAPPGERRVVRLEVPGLPAVPAAVYAPRSVADVLALDPAARALEPAARAAPRAVVFGARHTDSNQHVNSLAYLRLFEEAALGRFRALGHAAPGLARAAEVLYRKPCFAGDEVRVELQAFASGERAGAVGRFVSASGDGAPALHAAVCMLFEP